MTCQEVTEYIGGGGVFDRGALPTAVCEHLEKCSHCHSLWEFFCGGDSREPAPASEPRIREQILASLEPVRPLPSRGLLALGFLAIFGLISALLVALLGAPGVAGLTALQLAGVLAAVGVAASLVSVSLSGAMAPGERRAIAPTHLVIGVLAGLFALIAVLFPWEGGRNLLAGSWGCFRNGVLYSLPAAALILLALSRAAALSLDTVGAGAGLLAGLVGMVVLHLGCPMQTATHIALGHFIIPVAGAVIGYALGRLLPRVLPPPSAPRP